jgi:nitroreductase
METWDAIRARRNVRAYADQPVPEEHLRRIAEAGWRAPSASNRQHWDFVLVTDRPLRPIVKPDRRPFDEVVHNGQW